MHSSRVLRERFVCARLRAFRGVCVGRFSFRASRTGFVATRPCECNMADPPPDPRLTRARSALQKANLCADNASLAGVPALQDAPLLDMSAQAKTPLVAPAVVDLLTGDGGKALPRAPDTSAHQPRQMRVSRHRADQRNSHTRRAAHRWRVGDVCVSYVYFINR